MSLMVGVEAAWAKKKPSEEIPSPDSLRTEMLRSAGEALVGEEAPWLSGWTLDGDVWNLARAIADTTSDRVAIAFFATWCAPCRHGIGLLRDRADDLERNRIRVVLFNVAEEAEKARAFVGGTPPFPVVLDRYGNCKKPYLRTTGESVMLPQTVVVGRDGRVQMIIGREGADYVDRIIAGR
jgi:thiol-disulfide isomerase/thioredoxin